MKKIIKDYASIPNILILGAFALVFNLVLFPRVLPKGHSPLDLNFAYSPEEAYGIIGEYGEEGRYTYLLGEIIVDSVYPIVISLFLSFIIYSLYKNSSLAIIPMSVMIIDYLENVGIITILCNYPDVLTNVAIYTSVMTTCKWLFLAVILLIIFYGIIKKVLKK